MAEGILGLAGGGSTGLNQDVIDKLKAAERQSTVVPIEKRVESWGDESATMIAINLINKELVSSFQALSLDNTTNAFEQKTATTTGTSVNYDVDDVSALIAGTTNVDITQLAQKDVYQTGTFSDKTALVAGGTGGTLTIDIGTDSYDFDASVSYEDLASEINSNANFNATVEQVGDNDFRIVIKSSESGVASALTISQTGGVDLGITQQITAQNLKATIDGVDYDVSSNSITTQGSLKITANELGVSSITIREDTSGILTGAKDIVAKYNAMLVLVDSELDNPDSAVQDKSSLRLMKSNIKDMLFANYKDKDGVASSDQNIFNYGFDIDKTGFLSIDDTEFNKAVSSNLEGLKALFIGTAENKGLGTLLHTHTDALDGFEGLLTRYDDNMTTRKTALDKDLEGEIESLDNKYKQMAVEFAAYGSIIATMEAQFGSLKMMIDQSIASS